MGNLNLGTKKGVEVSAYTDSMLFYVSKGGGVETIDGNHKKVPYGIIDEVDNAPFSLEYVSETKRLYMNPGEAHIYGRQFRLTERTEIYNFNNTTESVELYCTVFFNLDLEDYVIQRVSIGIDISGAAYRDFTSTMTQDNVFSKGHGIYQAPVCRFRFTPLTGTYHDYSRLMPILENQTREETMKLDMSASIGNIPLNNLAVIENLLFKWRNASNEDMLEHYLALPKTQRNQNGYGYSYTAKCQSLGPVNNPTSVAMANMYSMREYSFTLNDLGKENYSFNESFKCHFAKLERIRISFSGRIVAKWLCVIYAGAYNEEVRNVYKDIQYQNNYAPTSVNIPDEIWLTASDIPSGGLRLVFYYREKNISTGMSFQKTIMYGIVTLDDYNAIQATEIDPFTHYGDTVYDIKQKLAYLDIKKDTTNGTLTITGSSREPYRRVYGAQGLVCEVRNLESFEINNLIGYIGMFFKGEVYQA